MKALSSMHRTRFQSEDIEIAARWGAGSRSTCNVGLCHTDLLFATHDIVPMPAVLGHEVSGIVAEIGADVNQFRVGITSSDRWRNRAEGVLGARPDVPSNASTLKRRCGGRRMRRV